MSDITVETGLRVNVNSYDQLIVKNTVDISVTGYSEHTDSLTVKTPFSVSLLGSPYYYEGISVEGYPSVDIEEHYTVPTSNGVDINIEGRRPSTGLVVKLASDQEPERYLTQVSDNSYKLYLLSTRSDVTLLTSPKEGEPQVDDLKFQPVSGSSVSYQLNGGNTLKLHVNSVGKTEFNIVGDSNYSQTKVTVEVVDEYPDAINIHNPQNFSIDYSVEIDEDLILNNNGNHVVLSGLHSLGYENIEVSNPVTIILPQNYTVSVHNTPDVSVSGGEYLASTIKIKTKPVVHISSEPKFTGDANVDSDQFDINIDSANMVQVSNGLKVGAYGWKEMPRSAIVVGGSRTLLRSVGVFINGEEIYSSAGFDVNVIGMKPEDIVVEHPTVVSIFRGKQIERDNVSVEAGQSITLDSVAYGGQISNIAIPCLVFYQSMVAGREFVKGQISEIIEISLDSSIKLGVKLYSCDNTLLNPSSFDSAYIQFNDSEKIGATIDPINSLIYAIISPDDFERLEILRGKVYNLNIHTTDKQQNNSIILSRKLRLV